MQHIKLSDLFKNIVGQASAKRKLGFYIESYGATSIIPNLMLVGPKGFGKTTIAREVAKGLILKDDKGKVIMKEDGITPRKKTFLEINCSTVRNVKAFINGFVIPFIQDKDVTVLFDEASELPKDVTMALLTILNPNPENRTSFSYDEYVCDFDFRRQTFLFATSEIQNVFHALVDRLERVDLEEYSLDDMAKIVQLGCKDITFEPDVLVEVSQVLRGNARAAQMMATKLQMFLKGRSHFKRKDWEELKKVLSIHPLGLSPLEIQILRYLTTSLSGTSLTSLSAQSGMSRDSLQKDVELYLQKHKLMAITTNGREITAKGIEYLRHLDGIGKLPTVGNKKPKLSAPVGV